ncbi:hypothetical protein ACLB1N_01905 [Escherichia coli]
MGTIFIQMVLLDMAEYLGRIFFSAAKIWDDIIYLLDYGFLEQQLAIDDAVGRKIIEPTDIETKKYNCLTSVREAWFDDREQRGRIESSPFRKKCYPYK